MFLISLFFCMLQVAKSFSGISQNSAQTEWTAGKQATPLVGRYRVKPYSFLKHFLYNIMQSFKEKIKTEKFFLRLKFKYNT